MCGWAWPLYSYPAATLCATSSLGHTHILAGLAHSAFPSTIKSPWKGMGTGRRVPYYLDGGLFYTPLPSLAYCVQVSHTVNLTYPYKCP